MLKRIMLRVACGGALASLSACGSIFDSEQREPWRTEVEAACLASGQVTETAGIRVSNAVKGPGACGVDRPFRVSAIDTPLASSPALVSLSSKKTPPPGALPFAPSDPSLNGWTQPGEPGLDNGGYTPAPLILGQQPVQITDGAPIRAASGSGLVLACSMVPGLTRWLATEVQPAALAAFGAPVVEMVTFGSYNCRRRNNARTGRLSEHAFANAVDVRGFRLADGRTTMVITGWRGAADEQAFWRDVAYGACATFTTVLGPGSSDGRHENHLHLDLARHSTQRQLHVCRPKAPKDWVAMARRDAAPQPSLYAGAIEEPLHGEDDE